MEYLAMALAALLIIVTAAAVISKRKRDRQLEEIICYLEQVQDGRALPQWQTFQEGRTGILQSEIYKMVIQMQEKTEKAGRDKEYLEKMLSDISHQIRTPLTSVTVMTDLLKEPDLPEEKRLAFTEGIESQVGRMNWLIKNLLTLSKLEANVLKLKKEEVRAEKLLQQAAEPFLLLAELKETELRIDADPDIFLSCDIHWTGEAISNIIKNCLEHTAAGGHVEVSASQSNLSTNIFIRDDGCGIDREDLPHIFERFYRGKNASPQSVGIGLALSRQIILQQNGVIEVHSEPGEGSEFHIKFYRGEL